VARALATEPKLLLLDEVMAGLRPTEIDVMVTFLQELNRRTGLTILLIEHVMRAVMALASNIVVVSYGEKIADPVLAVYDRVKEAAYVWTEGGDHVTEHDLVMFRTREAARTYFTSTFTDALWEKFEKDPVGTFRAMPSHQKVLLSRLARME